jgi:hypothetical protein
MESTDTSRDIFIITSVINTGNNPWSYTNVRSVYSPNERFAQTLQTIESIRMYAGNPFIMHVECSDISESMTQQLEERCDVFLQCKDLPHVRNVCLNSNKKGYGEVMKTLEAVKFIETHNIQCNRIFKLSGRYQLTERFSLLSYPTDEYGFLLFHKLPPKVNTVIYSVPSHKLLDYKNALLECDRVYKSSNPSFEDLLSLVCNPITKVPVLGVTGKVGVERSHVFEA